MLCAFRRRSYLCNHSPQPPLSFLIDVIAAPVLSYSELLSRTLWTCLGDVWVLKEGEEEVGEHVMLRPHRWASGERHLQRQTYGVHRCNYR